MTLEYSVDVPVWATLYIKAESEGEALSKALAYVGTHAKPTFATLNIESDGDEPDGVTVSEVATIHGLPDDATFDVMD